MKIGIIIGSLGFGGAERVTATLSNYWCSQNHRITIFTTMKKPDQEYVLDKGIDRIDCFSGNKLSTIKSLRKRIKDNCQDIIIIMDTPMCVVAVPALMGLHVPFVVSERSAPNTNAIKNSTRILSHVLMNYAIGFVFQTKGARDYYRKKIRERSIVIANPIDSKKIPMPFEGERDKRVVAVGRLVPAKNYPCLIDAFCVVHQTRPDYSLEIYGDGELWSSLTEYVNKNNASSFIRLMGASKSVLIDIRSASAYVLSSNLEGMPNALIEAMAIGLPCISTDCPSGGPRDLIENEKNGLLIEVNNSESLAESIDRVLTDKQFASNLSRNATLIRETLDVALVGSKWIGFLKTAIDRRTK